MPRHKMPLFLLLLLGPFLVSAGLESNGSNGRRASSNRSSPARLPIKPLDLQQASWERETEPEKGKTPKKTPSYTYIGKVLNHSPRLKGLTANAELEPRLNRAWNVFLINHDANAFFLTEGAIPR